MDKKNLIIKLFKSLRGENPAPEKMRSFVNIKFKRSLA